MEGFMHSERGFTFIELLLVAMIILLLIVFYWSTVGSQVSDKADLMGVATSADAIQAVLQYNDATIESVEFIEEQERIEACSDMHNAAFRVTISKQALDDTQEDVITTTIMVCCRGLGKQRYCQHEHHHATPPPDQSE
jgi:prepilin-type N-terminal cleavage/methylation domain-containing protein